MDQPTSPYPAHTPEGIDFEVARLDYVARDERVHPIGGLVMDGEVWFILADIESVCSVRPDRDYPLDPRDLIHVNRSHLGSKTWRIPNYLGDWIELVRDSGAVELCFKAGGLTRLHLGRWLLNTASPPLRAVGLREAHVQTLPIKRHRVYGVKYDRKRPHVLYRFYDDEDRLLYVGISLVLAQRFIAHRNTKAWWGKVARAEFSHYPDESSARLAERTAIAKEQPLYNIAS